jgi:hypothetical protein
MEPPEFLQPVFQLRIISSDSLWAVGGGECKSCGQKITFTSDCFVTEKLRVEKVS